MIAEAVAQLGSNNFLFDWFDVALVVILGFGLYRGRRNGMSKELLPLLQWITIVLVCGLVHPMFGQLFINLLGLTKMWGYLVAYMTLLLLVLIVFTPIKRQFTDRLAMSDHFKGSEYYLGMLAGLVRFACMLLVALALLNAPVYTSADIANTAAYNARWFGGGVQGYSGNYFPTLQQVQEQVFKKSIGGSFIENGPLGILLINTVPPGTDKEKSSAMPPQKKAGDKDWQLTGAQCRPTRMAGFSSATLERIRAASDIVDVIGAYLPLKKAGANFTALCPFHKEKTPSFNVNPHKQIFHCFGCHKGGDVFTFVKEYENIGFVDAVRRLAERAKIPIEQDSSPGEQQSRHLKDQLLQIHEQIAQRWQNCLLNEAAGQLARDYLAKRGVSADAIKLFRIGAAPELWDDTVNWAKSKGHELALVEKAGLILRKEGTDRFYDRFRGRLMFPICDEQGRVIGFSGRVLSGDEKTAKYVNSPETPIFTKSKVFFGLDKSKRAILDAGFAIVCEGQLDLIACFMAGVQNIVAPQGTAFTDQHSRIIKRYVDEVVLCFDSDEAGQNAAVRSLDHLLASGLAVRVAVVPAPHDPDSFIKANGGEAFRKLVEEAEGFFDYYLNRLCAQNDTGTDKGRIAILRAMAEVVHKTGNTVLADTYAQKTALRLGVSPEAVRAEFKKIPAAKPAPVEDEDESFETAAESESFRLSAQEFWLLKLLLLHENLVAWTALHLDVNWIMHSLARQIVAQRLAAQTNESWKNLAAFLDECGSTEMRSLVTEVVAEDRKIPNPEQQLADVALKLRNQFLDRQIAALAQKINQPDVPEAEQNKLLQAREKLRGQKRVPLSSVN